jgi:hypothetical protein
VYMQMKAPLQECDNGRETTNGVKGGARGNYRCAPVGVGSTWTLGRLTAGADPGDIELGVTVGRSVNYCSRNGLESIRNSEPDDNDSGHLQEKIDPEHSLLIALLRGAWEDLTGDSNRHYSMHVCGNIKFVKREAWRVKMWTAAWVLEGKTEPFGFIWVCKNADLERVVRPFVEKSLGIIPTLREPDRIYFISELKQEIKQWKTILANSSSRRLWPR